MKLYKNITRFQFRRLYPKGSDQERKLLWGSTIRVGDVVHSCFGFNFRVTRVTPQRMRAKSWCGHVRRNKEGWFVSEFLLEEEDGTYHFTDSCCWPRLSVEQIECYWGGCTDEYIAQQEALGWPMPLTKEITRRLRAGERICDDDGVILDDLKALRSAR